MPVATPLSYVLYLFSLVHVCTFGSTAKNSTQAGVAQREAVRPLDLGQDDEPVQIRLHAVGNAQLVALAPCACA